MRRLAQFVRLASRVSRLSASACICLACVSRLASVSHLSASACICLACVSRLRASRVRLRASRVCLASVSRLSASACICLASVSRLSASVHVKGSECVRRSSCLASVVLSRVCLASVVLSRVLSRVCRLVSRRSSCLASVCLLVNACGNWLSLCVGRHSKSSKGFCYRHTIAVHIDYVDYMNRPLIF